MNLWFRPLLRSRNLVAAIAGLLLAAAFPKIGISGLAWIAPALMLVAALGKHGVEAFRLGYLAGLVYYLASLYWLLLIPYRWHGLPFGPAAAWLCLSAFVALYPAIWVWLLSRGSNPRRVTFANPAGDWQNLAPGPTGSPTAPGECSQGVLARTWLGRSLWALSGAASWVALEMILTRFLSGFPWDLLGASQWQMLPLIQVASVTGIYGVSFLVVWFSLSLMSAALMVIRRPTSRSVWLGEILVPALVIAVVFNLGFRRIRHDTAAPARTFNVTLVQPSIPQTLIWDSSKDEERFRDLLRLSKQALTNKTDLLIWPEAAVPKLMRYDQETFDAVTGLARNHKVWMIVGADDAEPRGAASKIHEADYYNSSFLISPQCRIVKEYRKRNLVIFGEYIPLVRWLPFLKWFTPIDQGYAAGQRNVPFELAGLGVKVSVLICFEDLFPHLARRSVDSKTDFLVNLTNNGWFGESAAQWQHGSGALFRAVENGLPLIRCSNNGLTCCVDDHGRLREVFRDNRGSVYGAGCLTATVPLLGLGQQRLPTFYNQHGDWFGWVCVTIAGMMAALRLWRGRSTNFRGGGGIDYRSQ